MPWPGPTRPPAAPRRARGTCLSADIASIQYFGLGRGRAAYCPCDGVIESGERDRIGLQRCLKRLQVTEAVASQARAAGSLVPRGNVYAVKTSSGEARSLAD
jgi:hypothetical protein